MSWFEDHKGPYLRTEGYVWNCEDDDCGCSQAFMRNVYHNKATMTSVVFENVWEGSFHTDWESGAAQELGEYRRALRKSDPDREAAIIWQAGIDYELDT
jgi:hypothetical protein